MVAHILKKGHREITTTAAERQHIKLPEEEVEY